MFDGLLINIYKNVFCIKNEVFVLFHTSYQH